jgi:hypothetical protein
MPRGAVAGGRGGSPLGPGAGLRSRDTLAAMAFTLHLSDESTLYFQEDEQQYRFNQHGFLMVDDGSKTLTFSPHAWVMIEEDSANFEVQAFVV